MAKNIFTGEFVHQTFYNPPPAITTVKVTSMDPPYFAIRAQAAPSIDELLTDLPIKDKAYKEINMRCFVIDLEKETFSDRDRSELTFLNRLCLVVQRDKKYFISEKAIALFYAPTGLFMGNPKVPADMTKLAAFFLTYVLPGQYWRRYYAVYPLPETISARRQLDSNLTDIEREWSSLRTHFS
jgi:hypothetical protein